jgi:hypothetical protein
MQQTGPTQPPVEGGPITKAHLRRVFEALNPFFSQAKSDVAQILGTKLPNREFYAINGVLEGLLVDATTSVTGALRKL